MSANLHVAFGPLNDAQFEDAQRVIAAIEAIEQAPWSPDDEHDPADAGLNVAVETGFGEALRVICEKINDWVGWPMTFPYAQKDEQYVYIELENTDGGATPIVLINDEGPAVMQAISACDTIVQWDETGYGGADSNGSSMLFAPGMSRPLLRNADTDGTRSAYIDAETMQKMIEQNVGVEQMRSWALLTTRASEVAGDAAAVAQASELAELRVLA